MPGDEELREQRRIIGASWHTQGPNELFCGMHEIRIEDHIAAPIEAVFEAFSDYARFFRGKGFRSAEVTVPGASEPNGLGAFRRIETSGAVFLEEITAFERPHTFDYVIRELTTRGGRALPMAHRVGRVSFASNGGGTDITWTSEFDVPLPLLGRLAEPLLGSFASKAFETLIRQAKAELEASAAGRSLTPSDAV